MKIYILCDMEGISGIRYMEQVDVQSTAYEEGRQLMMADINACIEGCYRGGAKEVVVCDTHGGGGQVRVEQMDPRAVYERPAVGRMMPALDDTFGGVILLGHHAMAGTINGFLDHTMSSKTWFDYRLNGQPLGEIGVESAWAGHYKVPTIMVSGDQAACEEAVSTLGPVETAIVKWGTGRNRARCLHPKVGREIITQEAATAVQSIPTGKYKPFCPKTPAVIELTLYRTDYAEEYLRKPGVERINARTIRYQAATLLDIK